MNAGGRDDGGGSAGRAPAPLARLLANRFYLRVWAAGSLTNAMRWVEIIVASVTTFELTGSGFLVAVVASMRAWPMLFTGALVGALAESFERRRLLLAGQLLMTASTAAMATLAALGLLAVWHLALGGLATGLVWAADMAVRRRLLADLAGEALVARGVALDTVSNSVTRLIGPILGGVALETAGVAAAFALTALAHALSWVVTLPVVAPQDRRPFALRGLPRDIAEAVALALASPTIRVVLVGTAVMNLFGFSYTAIVAVWGAETFRVSATLIGVLAAAEPAGALLGGLLLAIRPPPFRPPVAFVAGTSLFLVGVAAAALSPHFPLAWAILAAGGIGSAVFGTMQTTLIMTHAPAEARSRVMGLVTTCIGLGPGGSLALGALSDSIGPAPAMAWTAGTGFALLAFAMRRGVPGRDPGS
jgi:MFS family permease